MNPSPGAPGFGGAYDDPSRHEFQPETGADPNVGRYWTEYDGLSFGTHARAYNASMSTSASASGVAFLRHDALSGVRLNGQH